MKPTTNHTEQQCMKNWIFPELCSPFSFFPVSRNKLINAICIGEKVLEYGHDNLNCRPKRLLMKHQLADRNAKIAGIVEYNRILKHGRHASFEFEPFGHQHAHDDQSTALQKKKAEYDRQYLSVQFAVIHVGKRHSRQQHVHIQLG